MAIKSLFLPDVLTMSRTRFFCSQLLLIVIGLMLIAFTRVAAALPNPGSTPALTATTVIISCEEDLKQDHDDYYFSRLLALALTKTIPTHGPFELKLIPVMPITNRLLLEVERGRVDVTWMPYKRNLRYDLMPIKIRLLKDLSDYRVFLVRDNEVQDFAAVKTIDDLRKYKGGMGSHWPDRQVMEENGLPLVLSPSYFNLFKMLKSNRFDYFSRGVYQVKAELDIHAGHGISLEPHLLLRYENPVYFYVRKDNTRLAERIERGLQIAIRDGSFDELFNQIDNLKWGEMLLNKNDRKIIPLATF